MYVFAIKSSQKEIAFDKIFILNSCEMVGTNKEVILSSRSPMSI